MADVSNPPVIPTQYVNGGAPLTVASLLSSFPASLSNVGLYAHVSDLYNNGVAGAGIDDILRCRYDATNSIYRWQPQRPDYNVSVAATGGTVTVTPLVTPPTLVLTGSLISNVTLTLTTTNAYVGQTQSFIQNSTLNLLLTTITGLIGSNVTLLSGATQFVQYGPSGWFKAS